MTKKMDDQAVAEVVGAVLLLAMAVAFFSVIYLQVLSDEGPVEKPFVTIIGKIENKNNVVLQDVVFEHQRGESLGMDTRVNLSFGGRAYDFLLSDSSLLDSQGKYDGFWNIGERLIYSGLNLSDLEVKGNIVDDESNSLVWWGTLQEGIVFEKLGGVWHFDENTGDTAADIMNGNDGKLKSIGPSGRLPFWDANNKIGDGASSLRFNGKYNFVEVPGDTVVLDITDELTIEAWLKLPDNNVLENYIFGPDFGYYPDIIQISDGVYAVVYQDQGLPGTKNKPGVIKTVNIFDDGTIMGYIYNNSYTFEPSACYWPEIIHAYDDIYLVSFVEGDPFVGTPSDGQLKTVQIFSNGTINNSFPSGHYRFGPKEVYEPDLVRIHDNICAVAYRNEATSTSKHVGFLRTVIIADDGSVISPVPSVNNNYQFDDKSCYSPSILHISGNIYAIAYRDDNYNGILKTIIIEDDGNIVGYKQFKEFASSQCYEPEIVHVSGNIYAIAYRDDVSPSNSVGYLCTLEIFDDGTIGSVIETQVFEPSYCVLPRITKTYDHIFSIVYQANSDFKLGYLTNVEINSDGSISDDISQKFRFNVGDGNVFARTPDVIYIADDIVGIVFRSGSSKNPHQGVLVTLRNGEYDRPDIPYGQKGVCKKGSYALYMNRTFISVTIKDITYSIPIGDSSGWHHIALTYSKNTDIVQLYINGNIVLTETYVDAYLSNDNPIYFGKDFFGNIDEVAIFPKVLTQAYIQEHMNSPITLENVVIEI